MGVRTLFSGVQALYSSLLTSISMKKSTVEALIDSWQRTGIVSAEQVTLMKTDLARVTSERSGSYFIAAVMYVGAAALALGALLFISSNWSAMTKEIKLGLTLLLPLLPLTYAYYRLCVCHCATVLGRAANILGLALIGGSIALIGQIYHLPANLEGFLWLWTLLTTPFLFIYRKPENVVFAAALTGAALFASLVNWVERTTYSDGTALLLFTLAVLMYAVVLNGLGILLRDHPTWDVGARLLRLGSGVIGVVTLFITTFEEYARAVADVPYYAYDEFGRALQSSASWMPLSLIFNAIFIVVLLYIMLRAVKFEEYGYAFTIVRIFGLYLIVKYCTLFYDLFNTGIFFMIGGLLFLGGAFMLERHKALFLRYLGKPDQA